MTEHEQLLRRSYEAFNARDIEAALGYMQPEVDWPNAIEGGRLRGRDEIRAYWQGQFTSLDPHVEPERFTSLEDGRVAVEVHQVVRDTAGNLIFDGTVEHVYAFRDGLVVRMDITD